METVHIRVYSPSGYPLVYDPKEHVNRINLLDTDSQPFLDRIVEKKTGHVYFLVPPGKYSVTAYLDVPGFGANYLIADNAGLGYEGPCDLNLNWECARSRVALVERLADAYAAQGWTPSGAFAAELDEARAALAKAGAAPDESTRARLATAALKPAMWAGERLAVEHAEFLIKKRPPRTDFKLGCGGFYPEEYDAHFVKALDMVTLPLYWGRFEPEDGKPGFDRVDALVALAERHGLIPKGHPLSWYNTSLPAWIADKPLEEILARLRLRIREILAHYRGRIKVYDVINEAHGWANDLRLTPEETWYVTRVAAEETAAADPGAQKIVNACIVFGDYRAAGLNDHTATVLPMQTPYEYFKDIIREGVPFDVVGLQLYNPSRDMLELSLCLDRYASLGKPIHLTELGVPSDTQDDPGAHARNLEVDINGMFWYAGLWHGAWDEVKQADWVQQFYTICYSKPAVQAVVWWSFRDTHLFLPHSGFERRDGSPKPALERLLALREQWGIGK